jgi:hypothetical protein
VEDGAGVLLVLLLWCWVILPWLTGGRGRLVAVLKAKFLNRAPDGSFLP